jgi:hypothetical protein
VKDTIRNYQTTLHIKNMAGSIENQFIYTNKCINIQILFLCNSHILKTEMINKGKISITNLKEGNL